MNIEVKTDCRFFTTEKGYKDCRALKELVCKNKKCTFYKSDCTEQTQEAEDIEKK